MNILYIGSRAFPNGLATIQRQILIAKGLIELGADCRVITRFPTGSDKSVPKKGIYEDIIPYECAAPKGYRPKGVFSRTFNKFFGFINETYLLWKYKKKNSTNVMLGVRLGFLNTLYYRIISKLFGYIYIIDVNELLGLDGDHGSNLNIKLFNKFSANLCDGLVLISDYLINFYTERKPQLKYVKTPIVCDVDYLQSIKTTKVDGDFFLYCSSSTYLDSIIFVIDSFCKIKENVELRLIISGHKEGVQKAKQYIQGTSKPDLISVESNIPYELLISYYTQAKGLLIPLPETIQHKARFPHKVGEYASSRQPIISNKWGEVDNYFDNNSAFLSEKYDSNEFATQMSKCFNSSNATLVENAYNIAKREFDYKVVSGKIIELINVIK